MVSFIFISDALEYLNGLLTARLADKNRLETTLESSILFNVLSVFLNCRCTDDLHLSPCKSRLENVGCVNCALCRTCADECVNLINKEDNVACLGNLVDGRLDSLLKVATVFCTCNHACQVKSNYSLVL